MLLTITIFTVFVLSGLSYLFGDFTDAKEQAAGGEERAEESRSQTGQATAPSSFIPGGESDALVSESRKREDAAPAAAESAKGEPAGPVVAGSSKSKDKQQKSVTVVLDGPKLKQVPQEVACKQQQQICEGQESPKSKRKVSSFGGGKLGSPPSAQSQQRHPSPGRSKKRDQEAADHGKCPSSSPVSGRNFSYGYTMANQAPCDPYVPRLY